MFACCDIVLASVEDHALLHGRGEVGEVIERLRAAQVAEMVVKLAEPACRVIAENVEAIVPAEPISDVVDTTAAGDSFAAAYIAARRAGAGCEAAARVGHRLAGAVVRHRGAIIPRSAMPAIVLTPEAA
jgi:2-dehydro-3-deoxygluconokinase